MGQNFINPDIPYNIAEASGGRNLRRPEIGPRHRPAHSSSWHSVPVRGGRRIDTALLPILQETMAEYNNVTIRHGDILKQNSPELVAEVF